MSSREDRPRLRKASAASPRLPRARTTRNERSAAGLEVSRRANSGRFRSPHLSRWRATAGLAEALAEAGRSPLSVSIADAVGRPVPVPGLARWLARVAPKGARGAVTLALVGDRQVRALNRRYRGIDQATDVLSFATSPEDRRMTEGGSAIRQRQRPFLGDVVIATGMAARQARMAGHSVATEFRILALHGLLHLLGYDHELDDGHMARLERTLRRRGGLEPGLIERNSVRPTQQGARRRSRGKGPTIE